MKTFLWFTAAVLFHVGLLLFGKLLMPSAVKKEMITVTEVDLTDAPKEKDEAEQEKEKVQDKVEAPPDQMVDAKMFEEAPPAAEAPAALSAMSLSDLAGALGGAVSDFGGGGGITSGGVIGGTGTGTLSSAAASDSMGGGEVDQRPRPMGSPNIKLPPELRKAKGKVIVRLVVDESGRITKPQVESSTNLSLNDHVLEGIADMRFEPATRGGKKVPCKVRLPIVLGAS